jgi:hypothetical protein
MRGNMAKRNWHIIRDDAGVTIARHLPARFDLLGEAQLRLTRPVSRARVAHQVRQDMWRALQNLRGFSPVVQVSHTDGALTIRAGGRLNAPVDPAAALEALSQVLANPANRQRWIAHASRHASTDHPATTGAPTPNG